MTEFNYKQRKQTKEYTEQDLQEAWEAGALYQEWECRSGEVKYKPNTFKEFLENLSDKNAL